MTELERVRTRIAELQALAYRDYIQEHELGRCFERLRELETEQALALGTRREPPSTETCEGFHHAP